MLFTMESNNPNVLNGLGQKHLEQLSGFCPDG